MSLAQQCSVKNQIYFVIDYCKIYFFQNNSTLCTKSVAEFSYLQSRQLSNLKCLNSRNYVNGFRHQRELHWPSLKILEDYHRNETIPC